MTDRDLEPFVALAANARRAEDLRDQELDAVDRVIATLVPFLESGYALPNWDKVTLSAYPLTEDSQQHAHERFYRFARQLHWIWLRSDGVLFTCHLYKRFCRKALYALRPWDGCTYCGSQGVLNNLLDWRRTILEKAEELKAELDQREQRIKHALVVCE